MIPYGTVEDALEYHLALGNEAWLDDTKDDAQRLTALIRGARALDGRYGRMFPGEKTGGYTQVRAWPREGAFDYCAGEELPTSLIPLSIIHASFELALVELAQPGAATPTLSLGRLTKSESVDGAASRSFFSPDEMALKTGPGGVLDGYRPTLTSVSDLLSCYLKSDTWDRWSAVVV